MTKEQRIKNLEVPKSTVDAVIDTDAYNEVDDQFAIGYMLRSSDKLRTLALYAAPYSFPDKVTTEEGMERSYEEIIRLLALAGEDKPVFRGSRTYLPDAKTPVISDAVLDLADRVKKYSPKSPLYVIAIGALTNIASAILLEPKMTENAVLVWLGGHSHDLGWTDEFNMRQDLLATRIVMTSGIPLVQIPCEGVASAFSISEPELKEYLVGKNPLADHLASNVLQAQAASPLKWARVLWDVTAVGWLIDPGFTISRIMPTFIPNDEFKYVKSDAPESRYVCWINRNALMTDLIDKLTK